MQSNPSDDFMSLPLEVILLFLKLDLFYMLAFFSNEIRFKYEPSYLLYFVTTTIYIVVNLEFTKLSFFESGNATLLLLLF
jgi:hypothetical protein